MKIQNNITKTDIKRALAEGTFDPKETSALATVTSLKNPEFCECRAIEYIAEAQEIMSQKVTYDAKLQELYASKINRALGLLALAKCTRRPEAATRKSKATHLR